MTITRTLFSFKLKSAAIDPYTIITTKLPTSKLNNKLKTVILLICGIANSKSNNISGISEKIESKITKARNLTNTIFFLDIPLEIIINSVPFSTGSRNINIVTTALNIASNKMTAACIAPGELTHIIMLGHCSIKGTMTIKVQIIRR